MRRKIVLVLIVTLLCASATASEIINVPLFKLTAKSITDGQSNVTLTPQLSFQFNLRIDPFGISATLNGSEEPIDKVLIHEGKRLEILLKEPLEYETEYTLCILGVKEIYSSQPSPLGEITFKTIPRVQFVSETVDNIKRSYCAQVKNNLTNSKDIVFIITARDNESNMVLDVKVLKKSVEGGECEDFPHTFSDIKKACTIYAFGFADFNTLTPLINPKQSAGE